jgi:mannose-6-phosphate isomerase-like protein (cupin superfamily)
MEPLSFKMKACKRDLDCLARLRQVDPKTFEQPVDYRNKVVLKPWGHEFLAFENEWTAVWSLYLRQGQSTSMHCHPSKHTTLLILEGEALCGGLQSKHHLRTGDCLEIDKGVFHSTRALSKPGIQLIEVETPPAKTDLVRLNDEYGRATQGYEGLSEMVTVNLERFSHFFFDSEQSVPLRGVAQQNSCRIGMHRLAAQTDLDQLLIGTDDHYLCCQGRLLDSRGENLLPPGHVATGHSLLSRRPHLKLDPPLLLMHINWNTRL